MRRWISAVCLAAVWLQVAHTLLTLDKNEKDKYIGEDRIVRSGSNFTLKCRSDHPVQWELPSFHRDFSEYSGSLVNRSNVTSSFNGQSEHLSVLKVTDAFYMDTGLYTCRKMGTNHSITQYVYVHDADHLVTLPEDDLYFDAIQQESLTIPCKPTHPSVQVRLDVTDQEMWNFDVHKGFTVDSIDASLGGYVECCWEYKDDSGCISFTIAVGVQTLQAPTPHIEPNSPVNHLTVGNDTKFNCSASCDMDVFIDINWTTPPEARQGIVIQNLSKAVKKTYGDAQYKETYRMLLIENARPEHNGTYACTVTDHTGKAKTTSFQLFVHDVGYGHLNLTTEVQDDVRLYPGETLELEFYVDAHPSADIQWFGPEGEIYSNHKFHLRKEGQTVTLIALNVQVSDSGAYKFVASNKAGNKTHHFHLVVLDIPHVLLTVNKDRIFYKRKAKFEFRCSVQGPYGNVSLGFRLCPNAGKCQELESIASFSSLNGSYTKGQVMQTTNEEKVKLKVFNERNIVQLTVTGVARSSGRYTCQACNLYGCSCVRNEQATTQVIVSAFSDGFELLNKNEYVTEGDELQLKCGVSLNTFTDRLEWTWHSADNKTLHLSSAALPKRVKLEKRLNSGFYVEELKWSDVTISSSGTFTCTATYLNGTIKQQSQIVEIFPVRKPKALNMTDTVINMEPGHLMKLACQVDGMPLPTVSWYKDGKVFNGGYKTGANQFVYEVNSAKSDHSGVYSCVAESKAGKSEQTFYVDVRTPLPFGILATIVTVIVIAIALLVILVIKLYKDKKRKAFFRAEELSKFDKGDPQSINPDLPVDEQAELLPYDRKWELPRERLKLGKQLGVGAFGRVLKGEAVGIKEDEPATTVAVKMVRSQGNELALKALMSELKIMIHMGSHLNVVNLLGACTKSVTRGELLVIVEYCRYGNVQNYLMRNRASFVNQINPLTGRLFPTLPGASQLAAGSHPPESHGADYRPDNEPTTPTTPTSPVLTGGSVLSEEVDSNSTVLLNGNAAHWPTNYRGDYRDQPARTICTHDLICWAYQIARGMAYLAKKKILHGDLAARNILLADNNIVKVADFGLAREVYRSGNYKKKGEGPLPVKWMAIESIMDRVFSTQSDVWAFGIVLWELFELGKTPYPGIEPDEQFFQRLQEGYRMPKPRYATDAIYQVMQQCWQLEPTERPDFNGLEQSLSAHLDESVREHYLQLDEPHLQANNEQQKNYLEMMKAPNYVNTGEGNQIEYVNVTGIKREERIASTTSDYLSMSDQSSLRRETGSDMYETDYLLMTPSPTANSVTDFPFPAVSLPAVEEMDSGLTAEEQVVFEQHVNGFSNPNYALGNTGLHVLDVIIGV